jgi:hypothetical protein
VIAVRVDKSKWEARYRRILSRRAYTQRVATLEAATLVARRAFATAPVDTGRFRKNLAEAANDAGVGPLPVNRTGRSRFAAVYLQRLLESVSYWTMMDERYQRERRTGQPFYAKILRKRERAELELRRFETTNDAIVIGGLYGQKDPTVRYKHYRGRGRVRQTKTRTIVELRNTEAHASIVERRTGVMRNAISAARGSVRQMTARKYRELLAGT